MYSAHNWKELGSRLRNTTGLPLYRGAVGVTFNQDTEGSELLLLSLIRSAPHSSEAYEAYEWLSHLYLYRGQYRSLIATMEQRWAAFPEKQERSQEQEGLAGLRGLPNQTVVQAAPSTLAHDRESIFIPLSIDGNSATYFFDTGAWVSCMSESEAKRLHLQIGNSSGTTSQSAGSQVSFRTAVARNVVIGNTQFRDVSFAIFPDSQEPWSDLAPGRKGIIGIPLLVGLQKVVWEKDGMVKLGEKSQPFDVQRSNLMFNNDHLVIEATVQNQRVSATVDTGAVTTDLYKPFADKFESLLRQFGKKDSTEVRGIGHAEKFDSVTLRELRIRIGNSDTVLSPAHVILKSLVGANCCVGNFGMDLFKQARALEIDFGTMTLRLLPAEK